MVTAMLVLLSLRSEWPTPVGYINCGCFTADLSLEKASEIRGDMLLRLVEDVGLSCSPLIFQEIRCPLGSLPRYAIPIRCGLGGNRGSVFNGWRSGR